jgi:hypothetical protein
MVGGAYINGTAESMGRDGFLWTIGPIGYNISLLIGKNITRIRYVYLYT